MPRLFRLSKATIGFTSIVSIITLSYIFNSSPDFNASLPDSISNLPSSETYSKLKQGAWTDLFKSNQDPFVGLGDAQLELASDGELHGWDKMMQKLNDESLGPKEKKALRGMLKRHPIELLIEHGEKKWNTLLTSQSKTLAQAVREYKRRYGRAPPKGFDQWWEFTRQNDVKIVDDYDQIWSDVEPFFVLSPATFRKRVDSLYETEASYYISLNPNGTHDLNGGVATSSRGVGLYNLLTPIAHLLPGPLTIHMSDHDLGSWILAEDQRAAIRQALKEGRYLSEEELKPFEQRVGRVEVKGQSSACREDSPAWKRSLARQNGETWIDQDKGTTFIHDHNATFDFCANPELQNHHGGYSWDHPRESTLRPIFQLSKFPRNPEFLTTPMQAYENATALTDLEKQELWESKTIDKLFWRGSTTGDSYFKRDGYDWRNSHRPHLALMTAEKKGSREMWMQRGEEWMLEQWGMEMLNDKYMNVGLMGKPHQCRNDDGTCGEMAAELTFTDGISSAEAAKYKYMLDVDGNGWSSRYHRLIMSGSVVLKSTIYPEWHTAWMTPWVHYVPAKVDYSDLYDIMAFFVGPPDGSSEGRDDLAQQISENALRFGEDHWRWEDMQAYMLRLLLEYSRLMADDREDATYNG